MAGVRVRLLGTACARIGKGDVDFAADQRFQALAFLAQRGTWVSRDHLAYLFWPDRPTPTARQNLRQLLRRLGRLSWLTDLEAESDRVRWPVRTDVAAFRRACETARWSTAVRLYGGPLAPLLEGDRNDEFQHWLRDERARLQQRWRDAAFARDAQLADRGSPLEAASLLQRVLEHDPLDEDAVRLRMRRLAEAGQGARALGAFETFAAHLRTELGVAPTPTTAQMAREIGAAVASSEPVLVSSGPAEVRPEATAFVGRQRERARLEARLAEPDCRLLTLTGVGGVGKSRLAQRAARAAEARYADGAFVVGLASVSSTATIPKAVARAARVVLPGRDAPEAELANALAERRLLVVLDDVDHLPDAGRLLPPLLAACPDLTLLVTSRRRLGLREEWLVPLDGLPCPPEGFDDPRTVDDYDAARLFLHHARRLVPDLHLAPPDVAAVGDVCRQVDGVPLGLELAAPWLRALRPTELAVALRRDHELLESRDEGRPARHRSLRAAFAHSWRSLRAPERTALARLSVFRGGARLDAAEAVARVRLPILAGLLDASLVRVDDAGRYRLHPLVSRFARERLEARPREARLTRARHARRALMTVEAAEPNLSGPAQATWLDHLEEEHDELRTALAHLAACGPTGQFLRLAGGLAWFWWRHGHLAEGRGWLQAALDIAEPVPATLRTRVLRGAGTLAFAQGDYPEARRRLSAALREARREGDREGVATTTNHLGMVAGAHQRLERADRLLRISRSLHLELGHRLGVAATSNNLGLVARMRGDLDEAERLHAEALELERAAGNTAAVARCLNNLGLTYEARSDAVRARAAYREGLGAAQAVGERQLVAYLENNLGALEAGAGDPREARSLLTRSLEAKRALGDRPGMANTLLRLGTAALRADDFDAARASLRESLALRAAAGDPRALPAAWEAIARLAASNERPYDAAVLLAAADRQREVLRVPVPTRDRAVVEAARADVAARLGPATHGAATREGHALSPEVVTARARALV